MLAALRGAIAQFKQLDEDLAIELRRRTRSAGAVPGQLSAAELTSLAANVRYQLARALRNQALCYPVGSPDRLNSLTQSLEAVAPLAAAHDDDPLAWPARVDALVCLRLAGRLEDAATRLAELSKLGPAEPLERRLRAEGVRLLLAGGKPEQALKAAGAAQDNADSAGAELDFARLEAIVAGWQKASSGGEQPAEADWEKRAADEVRHIQSLHGPYWTRRAEVLVAGALAKTAQTQSLDGLKRVAVNQYRAGRLDEALASYDLAADEAESKAQASEAFELRFTAAAIEHQRKHLQDAMRRYSELARRMPEQPKAATAHLAAIYDAAQLAERDKKFLDEYRQLLAEHLERWPRSPTAAQAALWSGKLLEHDRQSAQAAEVYRTVPRDSPQFSAAVEAASGAYERLLASRRTAGTPDEDAVRQVTKWLEGVIAGPAGQRPAAWTTLERQAALSAARIDLLDIAGGAAPAEKLLETAPAHSTDAPPDWQSTARILLVAALAARGQIEPAAAALEKVGPGARRRLAAHARLAFKGQTRP